MRRVLGVVCALAVLAACNGASEAPVRDASGGLQGSLTVFAAASLTEAFTDAKAHLERDHAGLGITSNFAASRALVQQVTDGAPADVIATADEATMQQLEDAGLVERPAVLAHNALAIAVAPGNPKGIRRLADLARSDVVVVLADPTVPAGKYAAVALARAGVTVHPRSLELDVKAALAKVTSGEADAAVVYRTDVTSAARAANAVAIPAAANQVVTYPIAVVRASRHKAAARALVRALRTGAGRAALRARGFLDP